MPDEPITPDQISKYQGKRKPIVDPLQVKNFNKANIMIKIVEGLFEKQDPLFENIKGNQGAIEMAILLPDNIGLMSEKDQEDEVRYLFQIFAESEKTDNLQSAKNSQLLP